jgi:hypothetical protein
MVGRILRRFRYLQPGPVDLSADRGKIYTLLVMVIISCDGMVPDSVVLTKSKHKAHHFCSYGTIYVMLVGKMNAS